MYGIRSIHDMCVLGMLKSWVWSAEGKLISINS